MASIRRHGNRYRAHLCVGGAGGDLFQGSVRPRVRKKIASSGLRPREPWRERRVVLRHGVWSRT